MTTLYTHAAVGLGLAHLAANRRMPWAYWGTAALLACAPDGDVFSSAQYGTLMGHRGITHSLLFAAALSLPVAAVAYRRFGMRWWALAGLLFAIVASHGLLDAMTRGGASIPFFWPLEGRYGNWGPMHVSDIAVQLPDPRTSRAIRSELLWVWLPLTVLMTALSGYRWLRRK
jgi:inner membrane protein